MAQGLMVITNIPSILLLGGAAVKALKDYRKQRAEGKDPQFIGADIGLDPEKLDFWK